MELTINIKCDGLVKALNRFCDIVELSGAGFLRETLNTANEEKTEVFDTIKEETVQVCDESKNNKTEDEEIIYTLEEVRAAFSELSKNKGKATAKDVLKNYGVSKVNDLPIEKYSEVMKAVKEA